MAIEAERLLAIFEARFASLEKGLEKARTKAQKSFGDIEKAGTRAENTLSSVGKRGLPQMNRQLQVTRFETANVAAQFQDIGVQLAGGTSPFLIAMQQGTQLNQVLGGAGLRGSVSLLGGAFASLLNPVSLATIGIIGLGGYAVQYFATLLSNSEPTEEALKNQASLIQRVADRWGDAIPALREYADEIKRAQEAAEREEGVKLVNEKELADVRIKIKDATVAMVDFVSQLQAAGEDQSIILEFQHAFDEFTEAADNGSLELENVQRVQDALAAAINSTGIPAISEFISFFDQLSDSALSAAGNVQKVNQAAAVTKLTDKNLPALGTLTPLESVNGRLTGDTIAIQNARAEATRSQYQIEQDKAAGGRSKAISDAERERQAVADLIAELEFERSLIGATALEREQANALRRAGGAATEEQREKIEGLTAQIYNEKLAVEQQQEAYRQLEQIGKTAINSLATAFADGKLEASEMIQIVIRLTEQLLTMKNIGGGSGGGGILGTILGAFGSLFGGGQLGIARAGGIGLYHSGGVVGSPSSVRSGVHPGVFAGAPRYHEGGIAGLKPGEVPAILQRGEIVLPKGQTPGSQGPAVNVTQVLNFTGTSSELEQFKRQAASEKASFEGRVVSAVKNAQQRRVLR